MPTTRFKGETAGERLDKSSISDSDMIQLRHKPGTIEDADKGISKAQLLSCPFGVSDTAAATAAKAADLTDSNPDFTLVSGREVVVCFTTANTASNPTLNFAGSGAIPLYRTNGEAVGSWPADTWMHLKYFFATVGNSTIQRWILLSPLPVDEVAANNMNSVTSNAVANSNAVDVRNITSTGNVRLVAIKQHNIVTVYFSVVNQITAGNDVTFGRLPEGFRPPMNVYGILNRSNGDSHNILLAQEVKVTTTGNVSSYTYNNQTLDAGASGCITYIVD